MLENSLPWTKAGDWDLNHKPIDSLHTTSLTRKQQVTTFLHRFMGEILLFHFKENSYTIDYTEPFLSVLFCPLKKSEYTMMRISNLKTSSLVIT